MHTFHLMVIIIFPKSGHWEPCGLAFVSGDMSPSVSETSCTTQRPGCCELLQARVWHEHSPGHPGHPGLTHRARPRPGRPWAAWFPAPFRAQSHRMDDLLGMVSFLQLCGFVFGHKLLPAHPCHRLLLPCSALMDLVPKVTLWLLRPLTPKTHEVASHLSLSPVTSSSTQPGQGSPRSLHS